MSNLQRLLKKNPVIPALKDDKQLNTALKSSSEVLFIMFGNICNIDNIVSSAKNNGKIVFVHMDLIDGLQSNEHAVKFIKQNTNADGIITTRSKNIKIAKENDLMAVQRIFLLDSLSIETAVAQMKSSNCDAIEILPGIIPKIILKLKRYSKVPLIAGGLISHKDDMLEALNAGATAISTTSSDIWQK